MPVTFPVATHGARPVPKSGSSLLFPDAIESAIVETIIRQGCPPELQKYKTWSRVPSESAPQVLASSLRGAGHSAPDCNIPHPIDDQPKEIQPGVAPYTNGFLQAVISAYSDHHNLTISPDDVWIAILTQFSYYVNAHGEELRNHFVAHKGQETIHLGPSAWPIGGPDAMERFANAMVQAIQRKVLDPELSEWIIPDFTTTTTKERIISTVLMMATLKTYFLYLVGGCGIPEITIEGEKSDWENILARVDKLSYGAEPTHWANLLRPILRRFISAVDGDIDATFWSTICDRERGSGFSSLTGWITAFCVWDHRGKWHGEERLPPRPDWVPKREQKGHNPRDLENLVIDGVVYPAMNMGELPRGFASVELGLVPGDGPVIPTLLMAGHLGTEVAGENIRPYAAWLLVKQ